MASLLLFCCDSVAESVRPLSDAQIAELPDDTLLLNVWLRGCDQLRAADFTGKSDPYVVFSLDEQELKSSVRAQELSPRWRPFEKFTFVVRDPSRAKLRINVYDADSSYKEDDDLGFEVFRLDDLVARSPRRKNGAAITLRDSESGGPTPERSRVLVDLQVETNIVSSPGARKWVAGVERIDQPSAVSGAHAYRARANDDSSRAKGSRCSRSRRTCTSLRCGQTAATGARATRTLAAARAAAMAARGWRASSRSTASRAAPRSPTSRRRSRPATTSQSRGS
jgi:hypothetical protein